MKILKILDSHDTGGVQTCEIQYINYWRSKGIVVDIVIVGEGKSYNTLENHTNHTIKLPNINIKDSNSKFEKYFINTLKRKLYALKNKVSINVKYAAIIYTNPKLESLACSISKEQSCPIFWHMPKSINNKAELYYYKLFLKRTKIIPIANSIYTMNTLEGYCHNYAYPGFDKTRISKKSKARNYSKKINIGVAARIKERKAQDLVIKSINNLIPQYPNLHLFIAGEPLNSEYSKYCQELANKNPRNFTFLGYIDNIPEFYSKIDLYFNSRLDAEPFGISVAEAMGSGLPIIAYKVGGPSEMVVNNHNGWLINEPTEISYTKKLSEALMCLHKWPAMGKESLERAKEFEASKNAEKVLRIINTYN